jgi:hypothetical protein
VITFEIIWRIPVSFYSFKMTISRSKCKHWNSRITPRSGSWNSLTIRGHRLSWVNKVDLANIKIQLSVQHTWFNIHGLIQGLKVSDHYERKQRLTMKFLEEETFCRQWTFWPGDVLAAKDNKEPIIIRLKRWVGPGLDVRVHKYTTYWAVKATIIPAPRNVTFCPRHLDNYCSEKQLAHSLANLGLGASRVGRTYS